MQLYTLVFRLMVKRSTHQHHAQNEFFSAQGVDEQADQGWFCNVIYKKVGAHRESICGMITDPMWPTPMLIFGPSMTTPTFLTTSQGIDAPSMAGCPLHTSSPMAPKCPSSPSGASFLPSKCRPDDKGVQFDCPFPPGLAATSSTSRESLAEAPLLIEPGEGKPHRLEGILSSRETEDDSELHEAHHTAYAKDSPVIRATCNVHQLAHPNEFVDPMGNEIHSMSSP